MLRFGLWLVHDSPKALVVIELASCRNYNCAEITAQLSCMTSGLEDRLIIFIIKFYCNNSRFTVVYSILVIILDMTSQDEKRGKWLKNEAKKFHDANFPEDTAPVVRPTDADLFTFLDKFLEDYSWREDILRSEILLHIFERDRYEPSQLHKYDILRWLRDKSFLSFTNTDDDGFLLITNVEEMQLHELVGALHPKIKPAVIEYSPATRVVIFNGKKHRMHASDNHKIFHLLATHPNERISKEKVWRSIGFRHTRKRDIDDFSKLVARVRTTVGASVEEIMLKDNVTLNATVKITD